MKFQGRWPPPIAIVAVEAFELNDSGARFRRIGRLSFLYASSVDAVALAHRLAALKLAYRGAIPPRAMYDGVPDLT